MKTKNHPDRPWGNEPDEGDWTTRSGLPCRIRRNDLGVWCGYVGVPNSHPLFRNHYADVCLRFDVHGGLTYSGKMRDETLDLWWFGFDCGHLGDDIPGLVSGHEGDIYRDVLFVSREVESLAEQLRKEGK